MTLKLTYQTKEEVPAENTALYIEEDGMFKLDIEGGVPDVQGLKTTLEKVRTEKNAAIKELKVFKTDFDGITPERVQELTDSEEKYKTSIAKTSEEMSNREKQLVEKWGAEAKGKDDIIAGLNTDVEEFVVKSAINAEIAKLQGDPEVLYDPIRKSISAYRHENGKGFGFKILDPEGNVRVGDNTGTDMSIAQRAEEFKQKKGFASAFPPSKGGDAPGNTGKTNTNSNSAAFDKLSPTEKLRLYREGKTN